MPESFPAHVQVLQAKVAALEMEENAKMPSVLSDPIKVPDVFVPQTGMSVAAATPAHKPASAAVVIKASLDVPLLGQPLLDPSPQVLHPCGGLSINVIQMTLVLASLDTTRSSWLLGVHAEVSSAYLKGANKQQCGWIRPGVHSLPTFCSNPWPISKLTRPLLERLGRRHTNPTTHTFCSQ